MLIRFLSSDCFSDIASVFSRFSVSDEFLTGKIRTLLKISRNI
jgi:hypothetical protein